TFLLLNPVWNIVNSFSELQRSLAAMERVFEVLAMEHDKPDRPDAREAPEVVRDLRFEDVAFEYREGRPVVSDFNVAAAGGSVSAASNSRAASNNAWPLPGRSWRRPRS